MGISNFPAALQPIIQQGFLAREFEEGLRSTLVFREIADREPFLNKIGETITKTRAGLKAPVSTYADPTANTNLDNGMTASGWSVEQYQLTIGMLCDTQDLNMVTQNVGIAKQFLRNARVNGIQGMQSVERMARMALYNAYLGGNTRVTTALVAPAATIYVDDIRGFQTVISNGVQVPVSSTHKMVCNINGNAYNLQGAAADVSNISTAYGGISGTLTFDGNVLVADAGLNSPVVSAVAPLVVRPNNKATTADLVTGTDLLAYQDLLNSVGYLRDNGVPGIGEEIATGQGVFNCYLSNSHLLALFKDQQFQYLYRGNPNDDVQKRAVLEDLLGLKFKPTTEAPQQTLSGTKINRAIVCGQGALVEGDFQSTGYSDNYGEKALVEVVDGIAMVTREPLDRLAQIIAQSWYWIGGFAVPTDITAKTDIIPTAGNSYFKRAVVHETA